MTDRPALLRRRRNLTALERIRSAGRDDAAAAVARARDLENAAEVRLRAAREALQLLEERRRSLRAGPPPGPETRAADLLRRQDGDQALRERIAAAHQAVRTAGRALAEAQRAGREAEAALAAAEAERRATDRAGTRTDRELRAADRDAAELDTEDLAASRRSRPGPG